ncbi:hypothetical protein [Planctomyces sp. SH-PL62]|uniref:hypothetical protein n=1 Tax=Planctomyces sp. SH-PL62 TaxID=1636152 RepID=UPI00078C4EC6|nr:hypothetical protein [Planctomyces sp. SH-PL62]AMV40812.1 hypothetical protein VT85_25490 [Planctomyces sp. SH-PL62]
MARRVSGWLLALTGFCLLAGGEARGEDRFYAIIFGSQTRPKQLRHTHTWATFIRVAGESTDPNTAEAYQHTISWLPATLDIRVLAPHPEPGANFDLDRTLDVVQGFGEHVTAWGPFQITPEVYQRSLDVLALIASGQVEYRAISTRFNLLISDCIHAVAAVDPQFGRGNYPLIRVGKPASRYIAREIMRRSPYDQRQVDAPWLFARLGLDRRGVELITP